jgi:hypothetical protein
MLSPIPEASAVSALQFLAMSNLGTTSAAQAICGAVVSAAASASVDTKICIFGPLLPLEAEQANLP